MKKPKKPITNVTPVVYKEPTYSPSILTSVCAKQYLYKPFILLPDLSDLFNKTIEVRIHKVYLTKFNKAV